MSFHLDDTLGDRLTFAARQEQRRREATLRPLGLSRLDWVILVAVGHAGLRHPSGIADHAGVDRAAISRALRRMESAGQITRDAGNGRRDGRTRSVVLTDTGKDVLARAAMLMQAADAATLGRLSPGEQELLDRLLRKLIAGDDSAPGSGQSRS